MAIGKFIGFLLCMLAAVAAGAFLDRAFFSDEIPYENLSEIAQDVAKKDIKGRISTGGIRLKSTENGPIIEVDPVLNALMVRESKWPGVLNWTARYSGQARALFEANGNNNCPEVLLRGRAAYCVFKRPIEGDPTLGTLIPSDRIVTPGVMIIEK